jgi:hypothetical protein
MRSAPTADPGGTGSEKGRKKEAGDIGSKGWANRSHGMEPSFIHRVQTTISDENGADNNKGIAECRFPNAD